MKNPVPKTMYSCDTKFISREKIAGQRIIDENSHKKTRYMVPMDFSMGNIPKNKISEDEGVDELTYRKKKHLVARCLALLREKGALTTMAMARDTRQSARSIGSALCDVPGIMREEIHGPRNPETGHYSRALLWMMPVAVAS